MLYGGGNVKRFKSLKMYNSLWFLGGKLFKSYNPVRGKKKIRQALKGHIFLQTYVPRRKTLRTKKELSQAPRVTSDFLVSLQCYICVTPTYKWREKKNLFSKPTYEEHLSIGDSWGSAEDLSGREGEVKWGEKEPERDKRGEQKQQCLHVAGWTDDCWHVLCQPARSPSTPALYTLFLSAPL